MGGGVESRMSDLPQQYPLPDTKSCGKVNREGPPQSTGDIRCWTAHKKHQTVHPGTSQPEQRQPGLATLSVNYAPAMALVTSALTLVVGLGYPAVGSMVVTNL